MGSNISAGLQQWATESEGSRHKAKFPSCVSFNLDCSYHRNTLPMFRVILLQMTYLIKKILQKNAQELLCYVEFRRNQVDSQD